MPRQKRDWTRVNLNLETSTYRVLERLAATMPGMTVPFLLRALADQTAAHAEQVIPFAEAAMARQRGAAIAAFESMIGPARQTLDTSPELQDEEPLEKRGEGQ